MLRLACASKPNTVPGEKDGCEWVDMLWCQGTGGPGHWTIQPKSKIHAKMHHMITMHVCSATLSHNPGAHTGHND